MNEKQFTFVLVLVCFAMGASVGVLILQAVPAEEEEETHMNCGYKDDKLHCCEEGVVCAIPDGYTSCIEIYRAMLVDHCKGMKSTERCTQYSENNVVGFHCTERGEPAKIGEVR